MGPDIQDSAPDAADPANGEGAAKTRGPRRRTPKSARLAVSATETFADHSRDARTRSGLEPDRRFRGGDAQDEALLQVQVDRFGVVVVVADRQVLAHLQEEVVAPLAEHDAAADSWRPHDRALQHLAEMVDHQAAELNDLDGSRVGVGAERQP